MENNHFLASEVDCGVAARMYLDQNNKEAMQVNYSVKRKMLKVNTANINIVHCCNQNCLRLLRTKTCALTYAEQEKK